jgi:uridine kinase
MGKAMGNAAFAGYLKTQVALHPGMTPQDGVKLCFQAASGAEHILADPAAARAALLAEFARTPPREIEVFEPISAEYSRCNLAAWKYWQLPPEWLFRMFFHSAPDNYVPGNSVPKNFAQDNSVPDNFPPEKRKDAETLFTEYLETVSACAEQGLLPFPGPAWRKYLEEYLAGGVRPVHHSEAYRLREEPAYRIVKREYEKLLPVLQKLATLQEQARQEKAVQEQIIQEQITQKQAMQKQTIRRQAGPKVIAIDGRAAAGKTTLAALLAQVLEAQVIPMDDFFLPAELRTAERLAESGGNIHYERFCAEVLPYLRKNESFSYRWFDCGIMDYSGSRLVQSSTWRIVEGSYSCHPAFGDYMDCRVFCDISPEEQKERIIKRNGPEMAELFFTRWIPMEEQYFKTGRIKEKADVVIEASK